MPLSHSALFRDPTEPAGFDLHPQYPLYGPVVFYDTRDHDHGATGYVLRDASNTGFIGTQGTLPNQGSAGAIMDFVINQNSQWSGAGYAFYDTFGTFNSVGTPTLAQLNAIMGGPPSNGPFVWIIATSPDLHDTRLYQPPPSGSVNEFIPVWSVETDWFNEAQHLDSWFGLGIRLAREILSTSQDDDIELSDGSFFPTSASTGSAGDIFPDTEMAFPTATYTNQLDSQLIVSMIDPVNGTYDLYCNGTWMTDDPYFGYSDYRFIGNGWWNLGDWNSPPSDRDSLRLSEGMFSAYLVNANYETPISYHMETPFVRLYNSLPVEGDYWLGIQSWGLWRGVPTAADLAAIASMMGV